MVQGPRATGAAQCGRGSLAISRIDSGCGAGCSGSRRASQSSQRSRSGPGAKRVRIAWAIVIRAASRDLSSLSMRRSWLNMPPSDTRESAANHEILEALHEFSGTDMRGVKCRCALQTSPWAAALSSWTVLSPKELVLTRGATSSMRGTLHSRIARIGRHDADHSALDASGAKERA